jgi:anaerobic selenocysteine-containing dehydrogenase
LHPDDAGPAGVKTDDIVLIGNRRGQLQLSAKVDATARPGVVIVEGIWPNADFSGGLGSIN